VKFASCRKSLYKRTWLSLFSFLKETQMFKTFLFILLPLLCLAKRAVQLDDNSFDQTVGRGRPAFVKFSGEHCSWCNALQPEFSKLINQMGRSPVIFAEVNLSQAPMLASRYQIQGVPTLLFLGPQSTRPIATYNGERTANEMQRWIESMLSQGPGQNL